MTDLSSQPTPDPASPSLTATEMACIVEFIDAYRSFTSRFVQVLASGQRLDAAWVSIIQPLMSQVIPDSGVAFSMTPDDLATAMKTLETTLAASLTSDSLKNYVSIAGLSSVL